MPKAKQLLKKTLFAKNPYKAAEKSDGLALVTEWAEFKNLDFKRIKKLMRTPLLLDGRNLYDPAKIRALGFTYRGVGRHDQAHRRVSGAYRAQYNAPGTRGKEVHLRAQARKWWQP